MCNIYNITINPFHYWNPCLHVANKHLARCDYMIINEENRSYMTMMRVEKVRGEQSRAKKRRDEKIYETRIKEKRRY